MLFRSDLDLLVKPIEEPRNPKNVVIPIDEDIKDEDNANDNDKYLKLQKLIDKLSENRSSNFDTWINVNWCLINICKKEGINSAKMNRLIHQFQNFLNRIMMKIKLMNGLKRILIELETMAMVGNIFIRLVLRRMPQNIMIN